MDRTLLSASVAVIAGLAGSGRTASPLASPSCWSPDRDGRPAAAVVNGRAVPMDAFERRMSRPPPRSGRPARAEVLASMVLDVLAEDEALRRGIAFPSAEIEARLAAIRADAGFLAAAAREGQTIADYAEGECHRLLRERLYASVTGGPKPPLPDEIRGYYGGHRYEFGKPPEVRVRRLRLTPKATGRTGDALQALAVELHERISSGRATFGDVAAPYWSAPARTFLGTWLALGQMRGAWAKEWEAEVFALDAGKISRPMRTDDGWEIVEVVERRAAVPPPPFEAVRDRARGKLEGERDEAWRRFWNEAIYRAAISYAVDLTGEKLPAPLHLADGPGSEKRFPDTLDPSAFGGVRGPMYVCALPPGQPQPIRVVAQATKLLEEPHYAVRAHATVPAGATVVLCQQRLGWSYVTFGNLGGYVPTALLRRKPAPDATR